MKLFSKYLEKKMRQASITYSYDESTGSLKMKGTKSGKIWYPMFQKGGKYKRGFWMPPS
jgi:hypothetical protein